MRVTRLLLASLVASTMSAGLAMAQNTSDHSQPTGQAAPNHSSDMAASNTDPAAGATKQRTQGLPAGTRPPVYGSDWAKQQSATKQQ